MNDDAELIAQTLAGQTQAFDQLVLRYQDRLYTALCRYLGSAEDAVDVAQEAFTQAYLKLQTFQRAAGFYTWLYRIAFNLAASRHRRRRPTLSVEHMRETAGQEPLDRGMGPAEQLEQQERRVQVQLALAALADDHRAVLILREIEGCDYETIGQVLDLAPGTVRSRLHRARMQLREQLKKTEVVQRP